MSSDPGATDPVEENKSTLTVQNGATAQDDTEHVVADNQLSKAQNGTTASVVAGDPASLGESEVKLEGISGVTLDP